MTYTLVSQSLAGFGGPHYFVEATESTMDDARVLAAKDTKNGFAIQAGFQKAGRGRNLGKVWESRPHENLLVTFGFNMPKPNTLRNRIGFLVALAIARTIEEDFGLAVSIKWPNDILVGDKKIAGILGELEQHWAYVGIGLNVGQNEFDPSVIHKSTSLARLGFEQVNPIDLVEPISRRIFEACQDTQWLSAINFRLYARSHKMRVRFPDQTIQVVQIERVLDNGALLIKDASGQAREVVSGELTSVDYTILEH